MDQVTVIIPVFNREKYIEKALRSVMNQSYANLQVVVVDDGSTDSSSKIIMDIVKQDSRVEYYYKENEGVSKARNLGLDRAKGKYLLFMDSDDYIPKTYVSDLYNTIKSYPNSLVMTRIDNLNENHKLMWTYPDLKMKANVKKNEFSYFEFLKTVLIPGGYSGSPCNKMFVRKLLDDNHIRFDETIHYCEDQLFCVRYADSVEGFFTAETEGYKRLLHSSSMVNSRNAAKTFNPKWETVFLAKTEIDRIVSDNSELSQMEKDELLFINTYYWKEEYLNVFNSAKRLGYSSTILTEQKAILKKKNAFSLFSSLKFWYTENGKLMDLLYAFVIRPIKTLFSR